MVLPLEEQFQAEMGARLNPRQPRPEGNILPTGKQLPPSTLPFLKREQTWNQMLADDPQLAGQTMAGQSVVDFFGGALGGIADIGNRLFTKTLRGRGNEPYNPIFQPESFAGQIGREVVGFGSQYPEGPIDHQSLSPLDQGLYFADLVDPSGGVIGDIAKPLVKSIPESTISAGFLSGWFKPKNIERGMKEFTGKNLPQGGSGTLPPQGTGIMFGDISDKLPEFSERVVNAFGKSNAPVAGYINPFDPSMTALADRHGNLLVSFDIDVSDRVRQFHDADWNIKTIVSHEKGQGHAKRFMDTITRLADEDHKTISLFAEPIGDASETGGLTKNQLIDFYKKYGFEFDELTGAGDYGIRKPKSRLQIDTSKPNITIDMSKKPPQGTKGILPSKKPLYKTSFVNPERVRTDHLTGWFDENIQVDIEDLKNLPGYKGEHTAMGSEYSQKNIAELTESMKKEGWSGDSVMVFVEKDGSVTIGEGNHRIQAALNAGLTEIPTEIKYFGNSNQNPNVWGQKYIDRSNIDIVQEPKIK